MNLCLTIICTLVTVLGPKDCPTDCSRLFPISAPRVCISADTATVCVLGDMMMHTAQIEHGNFDKSLRLVQDIISDAELAIANMEVCFAGKPYSGYPCFSAPDEYADAVADAGVDVFLMANNHILDKGTKGLERSLDLYEKMREERGIQHCGIGGKSLYVRAKGIRIALVNACYGTNLGPDKDLRPEKHINNLYKGDEIEKLISRDRDNADFIIALPHWGDEYRLKHNELQHKTAVKMIENGADIVVGAHPHVVQDCEEIDIEGRKIPVVYSLGNALSNMSAENTQLGQIARLSIVRDYVSGTKLLKYELIWIWCSRPGGFDENYTVIPVEEYIGRRNEWKNASDYDKMMQTYNRRIL